MSICEKTGKVSFWSEKTAKKAARNLINSGKAGSEKERLRPYRCGGHFHVGHDRVGTLQGAKRA